LLKLNHSLDINHKIEELQAKVNGLFDVPELQQFRVSLHIQGSFDRVNTVPSTIYVL